MDRPVSGIVTKQMASFLATSDRVPLNVETAISYDSKPKIFRPSAAAAPQKNLPVANLDELRAKSLVLDAQLLCPLDAVNHQAAAAGLRSTNAKQSPAPRKKKLKGSLQTLSPKLQTLSPKSHCLSFPYCQLGIG